MMAPSRAASPRPGVCRVSQPHFGRAVGRHRAPHARCHGEHHALRETGLAPAHLAFDGPPSRARSDARSFRSSRRARTPNVLRTHFRCSGGIRAASPGIEGAEDVRCRDRRVSTASTTISRRAVMPRMPPGFSGLMARTDRTANRLQRRSLYQLRTLYGISLVAIAAQLGFADRLGAGADQDRHARRRVRRLSRRAQRGSREPVSGLSRGQRRTARAGGVERDRRGRRVRRSVLHAHAAERAAVDSHGAALRRVRRFTRPACSGRARRARVGARTVALLSPRGQSRSAHRARVPAHRQVLAVDRARRGLSGRLFAAAAAAFVHRRWLAPARSTGQPRSRRSSARRRRCSRAMPTSADTRRTPNATTACSACSTGRCTSCTGSPAAAIREGDPQVVREVGREALVEQAEWLLARRDRPLRVVGR